MVYASELQDRNLPPAADLQWLDDQARMNDMTLEDAFQDLTIEQVENALAADETHGFPQDVFGLARLMLRTFSVLARGSVTLDRSSAELLKTDRAIEQRIAGMLELERLRIGQIDEAASMVGWHSDTRH
jgi:hypothetical protein